MKTKRPCNTQDGKLEAKKAGQLIKQKQIEINLYYSSFQLRAKNTLRIIQKELEDFKDRYRHRLFAIGQILYGCSF